MKASGLSDAQKALILNQGDEGTPVAEVCRKAGISGATDFSWTMRHAGLLRNEMLRVRQREDEKARPSTLTGC
jgi:putative transposase